MRIDSILREVGRNIRAGTARSGWALLIFGCFVSVLLTVDLSAVRDIRSQAERFRDSGAATLIITATATIDGASCDSLAQIEGIVASGARRTLESPWRPLALPGAPISRFETTVGFLNLLGVDGEPIRSERGGIYLSADTTQVLGLESGGRLQTDTDALPVHGTYNILDDGGAGALGYSGFIVAPSTGTFDECWAMVWPSQPAAESLLKSTVLPMSRDSLNSSSPRVEQLNSSLGVSFDGATLFSERITRWAWLFQTVVAFAGAWVFVRLRRVELASALHARVQRADLAVILMLENLLWAVVLGIMSLSLTVTLTAAWQLDFSSGIILGGRVILALIFGSLFGTLCAFHTVREKHLFRYFSER